MLTAQAGEGGEGPGRSGTALYLTASPQGPLVGQLILPGEIPAPLLARPKGLGEGAGLPVVHAGEEVSAVPSPCLGKPRGPAGGSPGGRGSSRSPGLGGGGGPPRSSAPPGWAPTRCDPGKWLNSSGKNPSAGSGHLETPRGRGVLGGCPGTRRNRANNRLSGLLGRHQDQAPGLPRPGGRGRRLPRPVLHPLPPSPPPLRSRSAPRGAGAA